MLCSARFALACSLGILDSATSVRNIARSSMSSKKPPVFGRQLEQDSSEPSSSDQHRIFPSVQAKNFPFKLVMLYTSIYKENAYTNQHRKKSLDGCTRILAERHQKASLALHCTAGEIYVSVYPGFQADELLATCQSFICGRFRHFVGISQPSICKLKYLSSIVYSQDLFQKSFLIENSLKALDGDAFPASRNNRRFTSSSDFSCQARFFEFGFAAATLSVINWNTEPALSAKTMLFQQLA